VLPEDEKRYKQEAAAPSLTAAEAIYSNDEEGTDKPHERNGQRADAEAEAVGGAIARELATRGRRELPRPPERDAYITADDLAALQHSEAALGSWPSGARNGWPVPVPVPVVHAGGLGWQNESPRSPSILRRYVRHTPTKISPPPTPGW
jgi:hypothetical protein